MFSNKPNKSYDTVDGVVWKSRSVAVIGFVIARVKGEKHPYVLVTQRSETMEDAPGKWCLPCGYLDWNETIEQATIREICEETSLNLLELEGVEKFPVIDINDSPDSERQNISIVSGYCLNVKMLPVIRTTEEACKVEWCRSIRSHLDEKDFAFGHRKLISRILYQM